MDRAFMKREDDTDRSENFPSLQPISVSPVAAALSPSTSVHSFTNIESPDDYYQQESGNTDIQRLTERYGDSAAAGCETIEPGQGAVDEHIPDVLLEFLPAESEKSGASRPTAAEYNNNNGTMSHACDFCPKRYSDKKKLKRHAGIHSESNLFSCPQCARKLRNQPAAVTSHMRTHTGERPHACVYCDKRFTYSSHMNEHIGTQHVDARHFTCKYCDDRFSTVGRRKNHLATQHNIVNTRTTQAKAQQCPNCPKRFRNKRHLQMHTRVHTGERPYSCKLCGKAFSLRYNFKRHAFVHTGEKPYQCMLCMVSFRDANNLKRHLKLHESPSMQNQSEQVPAIPGSTAVTLADDTVKTTDFHDIHVVENSVNNACSDDGQTLDFHSEQLVVSFSSAEEIKNRESTSELHELDLSAGDVCPERDGQFGGQRTDVREGYNSLCCPHCARRLSNKSALKRHMLTHTGEKPYSCTYCDKCFCQPGGLKAHIRTHTGERPFACNYCDKGFSSSTARRHHVMMHTQEKPHECPYCQKRFITRGKLRTHIRTHTDERPYSCTLCEKTFSSTDCLRRHAFVHLVEMPYQCSACVKSLLYRNVLELHDKLHKKPSHTANLNQLNESQLILTDNCNASNEKLTSGSKRRQVLELPEVHDSLNGNRTQPCDTGKPGLYSDEVVDSYSPNDDTKRINASTCELNNADAYSRCPSPESRSNKTKSKQPTASSLSDQPAVKLTTLSVEKPHACVYCDKRFVKTGNLNEHLRIHTGEMPYACGYCGKRFVTSSSIRNHVMIHTQEKPHECPYCEKRFIQCASLKVHIRTHTSKRPNTCRVCYKTFTSTNSLRRHAWVHAVEKPYQCMMCVKTFGLLCLLNRHLKLHAQNNNHSQTGSVRDISDHIPVTRNASIDNATAEKPFTQD